MDTVTDSVERKAAEAAGEQAGEGSMEQAGAAPNIPEQALGDAGQERQEVKGEMVYQKILSQVKSDVQAVRGDTDARSDAQDIGALQDVEAQVARLSDLASTKGVVYAVTVARKLEFYILDQLHDQLANKLYDTLLAKGLIEREA